MGHINVIVRNLVLNMMRYKSNEVLCLGAFVWKFTDRCDYFYLLSLNS